MSETWFSIISDLFVNLAAGWFGVVFIVPIQSKRVKVKFWLLTTNLVLGILCLEIAFLLRS